MFAHLTVLVLAMAPVFALPVASDITPTPTPNGGPDHILPTPTITTTTAPALVTPTHTPGPDDDMCWRHWPRGCKKTEVAAVALLIVVAVVLVIRLGMWIRAGINVWKAKRAAAASQRPNPEPKTSTSGDELPSYSEATVTPATYAASTIKTVSHPDHGCSHGDLGVRCDCAL